MHIITEWTHGFMLEQRQARLAELRAHPDVTVAYVLSGTETTGMHTLVMLDLAHNAVLPRLLKKLHETAEISRVFVEAPRPWE